MVRAQGILAEPGPAGPGLGGGVGALDGTTVMPFTPQTPGLAPGFQLPTMSSYNLPIPAGMRPIQAFTPDAFKQASVSRLSAGTVLTGILEDDLSSSKNNVGDVFSVRLEQGYSVNGTVLIPPQSKVIGCVMAAKSAKTQKFGAPGQLQVSMQTLVFPDGRSTRIYGFIEHNPAMDMKSKYGSDNPLSGPYHAAKAGVISVFSGLNSKTGLPINYPNIRSGLDFTLAKGELLPIRLNRFCDISNMTAAPAVPSTALAPVSAFPSADGMPPTAPQYGAASPVGQAATAGLLPGIAPGEDSRFSLTAPPEIPLPQKPTALPEPF
ncbi:MAG TPA: hypothetical protein V6C76_06325 [Drouetiella sp.]